MTVKYVIPNTDLTWQCPIVSKLIRGSMANAAVSLPRVAFGVTQMGDDGDDLYDDVGADSINQLKANIQQNKGSNSDDWEQRNQGDLDIAPQVAPRNEGGVRGGQPQPGLCISDLGWWVSDKNLEDILSKFGKLMTLKMYTDKKNGKSKGYVYVEFQDPRCLRKVKEALDGKEIHGKNCRIDFATELRMKQIDRTKTAKMKNNRAMRDQKRAHMQEMYHQPHNERLLRRHTNDEENFVSARYFEEEVAIFVIRLENFGDRLHLILEKGEGGMDGTVAENNGGGGGTMDIIITESGGKGAGVEEMNTGSMGMIRDPMVMTTITMEDVAAAIGEDIGNTMIDMEIDMARGGAVGKSVWAFREEGGHMGKGAGTDASGKDVGKSPVGIKGERSTEKIAMAGMTIADQAEIAVVATKTSHRIQ
eukprot:jgi/Bigna1/73916/fgenesh1_pg.26_\